MRTATRDNGLTNPAGLPAGHAQASLQRVHRRFRWALLVSALFHLSMITVFRIVVMFPQGPVDYYLLQIVPDTPPAAGNGRPSLRLGSADLYAGRQDVDLPVLDFAEIDRLRIRRALPEDFEALDTLSGGYPEDSWSRFTGGLQELGARLRDRLTGNPSSPDVSDPVPAAIHRPAPGWEGAVFWKDPGDKRGLLFTPPLEPLWNIPENGPSRFEFTITVDNSGRVTDAWTPDAEPADILEPLQLKLLQYRFEPLPDGGIAASRMGTLILRRARDGGS
ncbi:MAG TPA: hypothetical protein PK349_07455 [Candidatus Hydrogenedentes bacterium]|nr:hypothetical protein [Candidatus Hydrogenedentota bacterium]